jgi:chromosome segregation ATPase
LDGLISQAQADKRDVEAELRAVNDALQDRANRIGQQLSLLDALTKEKADLRRELEKLHYQIKDLKRSIEWYRERYRH